MQSAGKLTVAEDHKSQEGQVALSLYGVPAEVRVSLGNKHGTALETTSCQVRHHLHTNSSVNDSFIFMLCVSNIRAFSTSLYKGALLTLFTITSQFP